MWFSPDSRHITVGLTYCTSNTLYPLPAPAMPVLATSLIQSWDSNSMAYMHAEYTSYATEDEGGI